MTLPDIISQLVYLAVIFILFVVPRAFQKYRIPAPLTCFVFGVLTALLVTDHSHDSTLSLLAVLGISSLFLLAGLEISVADLRANYGHLLTHLLFRCMVVIFCIWIGTKYFDYTWRVAGLITLALLTPSTGFIIESIPRLGLNKSENFWVTSKAIAGELLALLFLFVILKSDSYLSFAMSSIVLVAIAFGLPPLFVFLGRIVIPHAPGSEFSLLVMVGVIAAYLTKQIGVYYLVGAFLAGFAARQLREKMPTLASEENLLAVKLFASFFIPFYFFYSGTQIPEHAMHWDSLLIGLGITLVVLPLRIANITLQRVLVHKDDYRSGFNVAIALTPTLIFTIVLANILHERYAISDELFGGLLIYAAISTMLPSLVISKPVTRNAEPAGH